MAVCQIRTKAGTVFSTFVSLLVIDIIALIGLIERISILKTTKKEQNAFISALPLYSLNKLYAW